MPRRTWKNRWRRGAAVALAAGSMLAIASVTVSGHLQPAEARTFPHNGAMAAGSRPTSLQPIVGAAADPATGGYWLVASDGGVFNFGAPFFGSTGTLTLSEPIVGAAATSDGGGYWLVAADGGVFSFGDARFFGSTGASVLNRPVVAMAATPDGGGYWLVAADGGVFSFGDARFAGSTGASVLNRPVVAMAAAPDGGGYWVVAADGGVFSFGDARFAGAATGSLQRSAVAITSTTASAYRVMSADGGVYAFGGAPFLGSAYVPPVAGETVAIDPGHDGGNGAAGGLISQPIANGAATESCDTVGTETSSGYTEHAFNFDVALRLESILAAEGARVVLTRTSDTGVGPCVNTRAAIGNAAHADAAISIHGDGGPVSGRGFDVIKPAPAISAYSNNTAIVPASGQLATDIREAFGAATGEPVSTYAGADGIDQRSDLGGLNLSAVPKVLIECANLQNPTDAGLTESPQWRQQAAQGLADGIGQFLQAEEIP
jgi:N-acetylmuramoyl-L-alanine amidase